MPEGNRPQLVLGGSGRVQRRDAGQAGSCGKGARRCLQLPPRLPGEVGDQGRGHVESAVPSLQDACECQCL